MFLFVHVICVIVGASFYFSLLLITIIGSEHHDLERFIHSYLFTYSATMEEHLHLVKQVFQMLKDHQLKVNCSKCKFAQRKLAFLGHEISAEGVSTDSSKVATIQDKKVPQNVREVWSFLGLVWYYRCFIQNFGTISGSLTALLKKGAVFVWTDQTEIAFQAQKHALISAPIFATPNFQEPFKIKTDAWEYGVGAVLMQKGHPIAFLSKALGPENRGLSTYENESLAILMAIDKWRMYLQIGEFIIWTDQKAMAYLEDQWLSTP